MGLIPCNMVSEIRAEDEETMDQLIKQGFLPLSTPVDRLGTSQAERVQMIAVFVVYQVYFGRKTQDEILLV